MNEINTKSDFALLLVLFDREGNEIGIPQADWECDLWTFSKANKFTASRHGGEWTNAREKEGRIRIICDGHGMGSGELRCELRLEIPDGDFPDGFRRVVADVQTGVSLAPGACPCNHDIVAVAQLPDAEGSRTDRIEAVREELSGRIEEVKETAEGAFPGDAGKKLEDIIDTNFSDNGAKYHGSVDGSRIDGGIPADLINGIVYECTQAANASSAQRADMVFRIADKGDWSYNNSYSFDQFGTAIKNIDGANIINGSAIEGAFPEDRGDALEEFNEKWFTKSPMITEKRPIFEGLIRGSFVSGDIPGTRVNGDVYRASQAFFASCAFGLTTKTFPPYDTITLENLGSHIKGSQIKDVRVDADNIENPEALGSKIAPDMVTVNGEKMDVSTIGSKIYVPGTRVGYPLDGSVIKNKTITGEKLWEPTSFGSRIVDMINPDTEDSNIDRVVVANSSYVLRAYSFELLAKKLKPYLTDNTEINNNTEPEENGNDTQA